MSQPTVLLCSCLGTMAPDAGAIGRGTGATCSRVHHCLCGDEIGSVQAALGRGGDVVVACGQEAAAFDELAQAMGAGDRLSTVDIRDRAGWSEDRDVGPKMAALLAEARLGTPPVPSVDVASAGVCLVWGPAEVAVPAAARLASALTVSCMLTEPEEVIVPAGAAIDIVAGRIRTATGALGRFAVEVDAFRTYLPGGRVRAFSAPRDGGRSECDIIVDLSGGRPLFPAHDKRDGYLRADPGDRVAVERVLFDAAQMVGTFEKPLHIRFDGSLCAHSRARQVGCTRCLDLCPTGAIAPAGDTVAIDPYICGGCGACAAVCPTGAAASDDPPVQHLFARMRAMAHTYAKAGGRAPRLLVHEAHGAEMIRLGARYGRGLPADVVPLEVRALAAFGHAEMLAGLALGFATVNLLPAPRSEREVIGREMRLSEAIAAGSGAAGRIALVEADDPDALSDLLYAGRPAPLKVEPIMALGGRRDVTRLAATALSGGEPPEAPVGLPEGAPYGAIVIDPQACTLCLACVGLCPPGALGDGGDRRPEVNFRETACVQCGLCATVCPEDAITLVPQLDLSPAALAPRVLNHEEPFCCIECGKPFGTKKTIDRITAKLSGVHAMFTNSDNIRLIQMCDDCRVRAQFRGGEPFAVGERPRVRTTDDYLRERDKN